MPDPIDLNTARESREVKKYRSVLNECLDRMALAGHLRLAASLAKLSAACSKLHAEERDAREMERE